MPQVFQVSRSRDRETKTEGEAAAVEAQAPGAEEDVIAVVLPMFCVGGIRARAWISQAIARSRARDVTSGTYWGVRVM